MRRSVRGPVLFGVILSLLACGREPSPAVVLALAPVEVSWTAGAGGPVAPLPVRIEASRPVDVECATTAPWLTVSPAKARAPVTISVSASPGGLPAGTHSAQVTVRVDGIASPLVVAARLSIGADSPPPPSPPAATEPAAPSPPQVATVPSPAPEVPYGQRALSGEALQRTKEATVLIESRYRPMGRDASHLSDGDYATMNGSGFVIDERGLILTNEHVVSSLYVPEDEAGGTAAERALRRVAYVLDRVVVRLHSGTERTRAFEGQVVATRPYPLDLALVRIEPDTPLAAVPGLDPAVRANNFSPSETYRVWAVGFPHGVWMETDLERFRMTKNPNGPDVSVREGVVTAMRRDAHDVVKAIEHSCNIEPGNSGGPLVDAAGFLVGINSLGGGRSSFAIPANAIADTFFDTLACNGYGNIAESASKRTLVVDPAASPAPPKAGEEPLVFAQIGDALAAARNGDVVRLAAAEFRLKEPLAVRTGIRLEGAGIGRTVLRAAGPEGKGIEGYAVFLGGKRYVEIHDLTVVNEGGNGIWVYPEATDQMHVHDIEIRAAYWALGAGENTAFDLVHCELSAGACFQGAECRPRVERLRVNAQGFLQGMAVRTADKAAPLLIGCRLLGDSGCLWACAASTPRLVGCEIANLGVTAAFSPLSASEESRVEMEGCAFWSHYGSVIAPGEGGTVRVIDSVFRGPASFPPVSVSKPSSAVHLERCLFQWQGAALLVTGGSASLDDCAVLFDPEYDLSPFEWPEPYVAPVRAEPVPVQLTEEEVRRQQEAQEKRRREHPIGVVVHGGEASVSYRGNLFRSAQGGVAVRIERGASEQDGGGNRVTGAEEVLRTDEAWYGD